MRLSLKCATALVVAALMLSGTVAAEPSERDVAKRKDTKSTEKKSDETKDEKKDPVKEEDAKIAKYEVRVDGMM